MVAVTFFGIAATSFHGLGFLVLKPAMVSGVEPLAASAIRLIGAAFMISIVSLWPAKLFQPKSKVTPSLIGHAILPGIIGYVMSSSLLLYAFSNLDAAVAMVLGSLSPILVLPILWLKEGVLASPPAILGAVLAVAGTAVIVMF